MPAKKPKKDAPRRGTPHGKAGGKPHACRAPTPKKSASARKAPAPAKPAIAKAVPEAGLGTVVVDGSNVAMQRLVAGKPTIENIQIVHDELTKLGFKPVIFVDASLRHRFTDTEKAAFEKWYQEGFVTQAPKGVAGDEAILEFATRKNAPVLSNDTFEGYEERYPWVTDRSRRIPFNLVHGELILYRTTGAAKARQAHPAQPTVARQPTAPAAPAPPRRDGAPPPPPAAPNPEREAFAEKLLEAFRRASPTGEPVPLDDFLRRLRDLIPNFHAGNYGYSKPSALIQAFPELFALDRRSDHGDVSELNGPREWPIHVCKARR